MELFGSSDDKSTDTDAHIADVAGPTATADRVKLITDLLNEDEEVIHALRIR